LCRANCRHSCETTKAAVAPETEGCSARMTILSILLHRTVEPEMDVATMMHKHTKQLAHRCHCISKTRLSLSTPYFHLCIFLGQAKNVHTSPGAILSGLLSASLLSSYVHVNCPSPYRESAAHLCSPCQYHVLLKVKVLNLYSASSRTCACL